jgi:hypothetical protein
MLMLMLGYGIYVYRSLEAVFFLGQYFVKFQPEKYGGFKSILGHDS